ncbi:MAG TPA: hypothetical protein VJ372_18240 [Pyrinomonadaceae bacterium]|nr:hypothetical protein [Pyrinomonadaceae bacterium]
MIRKHLMWQTVGFFVLALLSQAASSASAFHHLRETAIEHDGIEQTSQQDRDDATYRVWFEANAANDLPASFELGKKYLKEFPNGKYAAYLNKWVPATRAKLFNIAYRERNTDAMISLGNEALGAEPDNLNYVITLALHLITNELNAKPPNYAHATEAETFTRRAVKLIESGKKPANDLQWNRNQSLTYFYQVLGGIEERKKNPDKALEYYEKACRTDAENALSFFSSGRIYQDRYLKAVERYRTIPEAERNSPVQRSQVKTVLEELTDAADATIDRWVTFLKLTAINNTYGATRSQVEKSVAELYKYRHPDSPEGYKELIKP